MSRIKGSTYTGEADTAVAALRSISLLLSVLEGKTATGGLHHTSGVRGGLVGVSPAVGKTLHLQRRKRTCQLWIDLDDYSIGKVPSQR